MRQNITDPLNASKLHRQHVIKFCLPDGCPYPFVSPASCAIETGMQVCCPSSNPAYTLSYKPVQANVKDIAGFTNSHITTYYLHTNGRHTEC
jgi:hypothetical protein